MHDRCINCKLNRKTINETFNGTTIIIECIFTGETLEIKSCPYDDKTERDFC